MTVYAARLDAVRAELARRDLDGFIVPLTDEHRSERIDAYAARLQWLTGFTGSAATAVVLSYRAVLFVSGIYSLQANRQLDLGLWECQESDDRNALSVWLADNTSDGVFIGYDPWLHTETELGELSHGIGMRNGTAVPVRTNPVDSVWLDRPQPSVSPAVIHEERYAGQSSESKRKEVGAWLHTHQAHAVLLTALDSIAWVFNIRGSDVPYVPVVRAFALIRVDGRADLFIDPNKITPAVRAHLGDTVQLHVYSELLEHLQRLDRQTIVVDPSSVASALFQALKKACVNVVRDRDPTVLLRAVKNATEIAGSRTAHLTDGVAVTRFLHWVAIQAPTRSVTEISAAGKLTELRTEGPNLCGKSWETISAVGAHAALPHYVPNESTDAALVDGSLFLVDSGAQYLNGTTDVCRTIAVGTPTAEMRRSFTLALKGHIALASSVFPAGTTGIQLDAFARRFLWAEALDYPHATGHGVGSYLKIHEGPQRVAHTGDCSEPLLRGMIISNEPGYYKEKEYGLRIENLLLVVQRSYDGAGRQWLAFETLTLAPIDRALIDTRLLSEHERGWLDEYHARVRQVLEPLLDISTREWVAQVTSPLGSSA